MTEKPHGTELRYQHGCRCAECRRATSEQHRRRTWDRRATRVDGEAIDVVHSASAYNNAHCRCEICVRAHRDRLAAARARRLATRVLIDGRLVAVKAARHGTVSTYGNHGCRCEPCTEAMHADRRK